MIGDGLREELTSLAGVATADFEPTGSSSSAEVRVRLEPGADARAVGVEVQRVLASRGLRSRLAGPEAPPPPPIEDAAPEAGPGVGELEAGDGSALDEPPVAAGAAARDVLESVLVEETRDGVTVTATTSTGRRFSERGEASDDGIARAVVAVVGVLVDGRPARLLSMSVSEADGTSIATVLVERAGGARAAGSAIVRAGVPHAVARATWACLG
jgi:hypothetical protein